MNKNAFTLIESVIVLAIITMLFAISIPLFLKFTEKTKLKTAARSVASALRTARDHAISTTQNCEVYFNNPSTGQYYIFGSTPTGFDIIEKIFKLPQGIEFANIGFTENIARFTSTGMLNEEADYTSIDVRNGESTRTITVERRTGRVEID